MSRFSVSSMKKRTLGPATAPERRLLGLEGVVPLPPGVEQRIEVLVRLVVVAEDGVELHPGVQQRLVGQLELLAVVVGRAPVVDVVAQHEHEVVLELLPERLHLRRDLVLRAVAAPRVSDDREAQRARLARELQLLARAAAADGCATGRGRARRGRARRPRRRARWRGERGAAEEAGAHSRCQGNRGAIMERSAGAFAGSGWLPVAFALCAALAGCGGGLVQPHPAVDAHPDADRAARRLPRPPSCATGRPSSPWPPRSTPRRRASATASRSPPPASSPASSSSRSRTSSSGRERAATSTTSRTGSSPTGPSGPSGGRRASRSPSTRTWRTTPRSSPRRRRWRRRPRATSACPCASGPAGAVTVGVDESLEDEDAVGEATVTYRGRHDRSARDRVLAALRDRRRPAGRATRTRSSTSWAT